MPRAKLTEEEKQNNKIRSYRWYKRWHELALEFLGTVDAGKPNIEQDGIDKVPALLRTTYKLMSAFKAFGYATADYYAGVALDLYIQDWESQRRG